MWSHGQTLLQICGGCSQNKGGKLLQAGRGDKSTVGELVQFITVLSREQLRKICLEQIVYKQQSDLESDQTCTEVPGWGCTEKCCRLL